MDQKRTDEFVDLTPGINVGEKVLCDICSKEVPMEETYDCPCGLVVCNDCEHECSDGY